MKTVAIAKTYCHHQLVNMPAGDGLVWPEIFAHVCCFSHLRQKVMTYFWNRALQSGRTEIHTQDPDVTFLPRLTETLPPTFTWLIVFVAGIKQLLHYPYPITLVNSMFQDGVTATITETR